jgi:hypothetical protein
MSNRGVHLSHPLHLAPHYQQRLIHPSHSFWRPPHGHITGFRLLGRATRRRQHQYHPCPARERISRSPGPLRRRQRVWMNDDLAPLRLPPRLVSAFHAQPRRIML